MGQYVVLPTIWWKFCWTRAGHAWGSSGHGHSNWSAGATIAAALDSLGLKLPSSASNGKPVRKLDEANLNPEFFPIFFQTNLYMIIFLFLLIILPKSLLPCWSHQFFGRSTLLQPDPLTCNLVCPRHSQIIQDNSEKQVSSCTRQFWLENLTCFPLF